jgi:hypothetical protein
VPYHNLSQMAVDTICTNDKVRCIRLSVLKYQCSIGSVERRLNVQDSSLGLDRRAQFDSTIEQASVEVSTVEVPIEGSRVS